MAPSGTTFGHLQLETISIGLMKVDVPATATPTVPSHLGNDYFRDSENQRSRHAPSDVNYTNDLLWDGTGCVSGSCCTFNSPPWFCKNLSTPTTDDIQLHHCKDEALSNEDVPFEIVELYVQ